MPLSKRLYHTLLTHSCPHCGNKLERPGSFFWRARRYSCQRCGQPVQLSYEDKLKLFDEETRRSGRPVQKA
jgi:hypothetical protein